MDASHLLRIRQENMPKFIRYNPTTDSSTNTWKRQLQSAAGTRNKPQQQFTQVCDAFKPEPISNHFTATSTDGGNKDYQQTLLYNAGQQTCGCAGNTQPPLFQYISSPALAVPANPVKGQNPAGPCTCINQPYGIRNAILDSVCCPGKDMFIPS